MPHQKFCFRAKGILNQDLKKGGLLKIQSETDILKQEIKLQRKDETYCTKILNTCAAQTIIKQCLAANSTLGNELVTYRTNKEPGCFLRNLDYARENPLESTQTTKTNALVHACDFRDN